MTHDDPDAVRHANDEPAAALTAVAGAVAEPVAAAAVDLAPDAPPAMVVALAAERAEARAARDWSRADGLKARIEAAGWKVVDTGRRWRLEPAVPADAVVDGEPRYGSARSVPTVLDEPPTMAATVLVVADDDGAVGAVITALRVHASAGTQLLIVANEPTPEVAATLVQATAPGPADADPSPAVEVIRTSARLGRAAALNVGMRRARGAVVVMADGSLLPTADAVAPVAAALADADVAVVGAVGLAGRDAAHLSVAAGASPDAVTGGWLGFRRDDYLRLGPIDDGFVAPEHLDAWWCLTLRAGDPGTEPRRAVRADVPVEQHGHAAGAAGTAPTAVERDPARARLARRNAYRVLDAFRDRPDLLAASGAGPGGDRP